MPFCYQGTDDGKAFLVTVKSTKRVHMDMLYSLYHREYGKHASAWKFEGMNETKGKKSIE